MLARETAQDMALAGIAEKKFANLVRHLERAILIASCHGMSIPQVGQEPSGGVGRHPQRTYRARGLCYWFRYCVNRHACPRERRLFRNHPERQRSAAAREFHRCVGLSRGRQSMRGVGDRHCGRCECWSGVQLLGRKIGDRRARRRATNWCKGHRALPDLPFVRQQITRSPGRHADAHGHASGHGVPSPVLSRITRQAIAMAFDQPSPDAPVGMATVAIAFPVCGMTGSSV